VAILVALLFSKNVYSASLGSYFTFYLISKFGVEVQTAQFYLFAFLVGIVAGTIAGGAVGDKVGRIPVMWFSIVGALPFALMLPYANLFWTGVLAVTVAMIMASAFSAILVYAQELLPGRVGLVAGRISAKGSAPRIENHITGMRPTLSPTRPPSSVPITTPIRKAKR
jgi:FSR family fosmidomycin resistance protein-like MFS transporter